MSIIRAQRPTSNFYMLDKKISEDKRLSWAARGLLIFLLGKPDYWEVSVEALVNCGPEKKGNRKEAIYGYLKELIGAGYIFRKKRSNGEMDYLVSESPRDSENGENPNWANPNQANPNLGYPTQVSTDVLESTEKAASNDKRAKRVFVDRPEDVDENTWNDFLLVRKGHKAPVTETALSGIRREASKARMSLNAALQEICARGWRGFKAEWVEKKAAPKSWSDINAETIAELTGSYRDYEPDDQAIDI